MAQDFFVVRNGQEQGPLTGQQIKSMASTGKLLPTDQVRRSDMQAPIKAGAIKGLFPDDPKPAPPPLPPAPVPAAISPQPAGDQKKPRFSKQTITIASIIGGACLFLCCGTCGIIGILNKDRKPQDGAQASKDGPKSPSTSSKLVATIKHDRYTQVIMPELPPERVHDKEEGELERDIGEVAVPDILKVDFLNGPNGEPVHMVKYFDISKLEGGPETKVLRQIGYLYRNKAGKNVYHGPWCYFFNGDVKRKESETVYVHGAMKFSQSWDVKGRQLSFEFFKSDADHTQSVYDYFNNGGFRFHGQFKNVRHVPTKNGSKCERVPDGLHYYYWEQNGAVRQEELYENGQQTGIAIYNLQGVKVSGKGKLGS